MTAVLGIVAAPYAGMFFGHKLSDPEKINTLVWIIRIFSLRLVLSIFAAVPVAQQTKDLNFKPLYISNLCGTCAYLVCAPIFALWGFGVWSIVVAQIIEHIILSALLFYFYPFIPSWQFNFKLAKSYFTYNTNLFISSIITVIITNGDDLVVGRFIGAAALGFYNIGQQFAMFVVKVFSQNLNEIFFPAFAKQQNDRRALSRQFYKAFHLINSVAIPAICGLVVLAENLVQMLFPPTWHSVLYIFYVLSIGAVFASLLGVAGPVFGSLNRPQIIRNGRMLALATFILLVYPLVKTWQVIGVCWLMVIMEAATALYLAVQLSKTLDRFYVNILKVLSTIVPCSLAMMGITELFLNLVGHTWMGLTLTTLIGIIIYSSAMLVLDSQFKSNLQDGYALFAAKLSSWPNNRMSS